MKLKYRKVLSELSQACNDLGGPLDGTATHFFKYRDRQEALMEVHRVLYGILTQHKENEYNDQDWEEATEALERLKALKKKIYPDKRGYSLHIDTEIDPS